MSLKGSELGWGLLCVFLTLGFNSSQVRAQTPNTPLACNVSSSIALDLDKFAGIWWEIARQPVGLMFCTEINVTVLSTTTDTDNVLIDTTYSNTPLFPWVNQTMNATLSVANGTVAPTGYNFSYTNPPTQTPYTVFKILDTDYTTFAFICGYTNATDNSTEFGMIIARNRSLSTAVLDSLESQSSALSTNFANGSMSLITQDETCTGNGADPSTAFTVFYAIFAFVIYHLTK